jgi:biotin carboxylase
VSVMTTAHVLVVGTGQQYPELIRDTAPGACTSVLCRLELLPFVRATGSHRMVVGAPADGPDEEWLTLARAIHRIQPITRVVAFGELDQDRAALIGTALGTGGHPPQTVHWVYDKDAMRARLRAAGVDDTPAARVADAAGLRRFIGEHGLPCIVKPVSGAGSVGVTVLREAGGAEAAFDRAAARFDGVPDAGVLVERFHTGPQYSVEALSEAGEHQMLAVTGKFSHPENFVELGHVVPADLDEDIRLACHDLVGRVLDALGIESGATHTELVLTADGPRVIETHIRPAGDEIPELVHAATGVDLAACLARQAVGDKVLPDVRATLAASAGNGRYEAIWFTLPATGGTLVQIRGLDRLAENSRCTVSALLDPGDEVVHPANSDSRIACARASAGSADAAVRLAREAAESLTGVIEIPADRPARLA